MEARCSQKHPWKNDKTKRKGKAKTQDKTQQDTQQPDINQKTRKECRMMARRGDLGDEAGQLDGVCTRRMEQAESHPPLGN